MNTAEKIQTLQENTPEQFNLTLLIRRIHFRRDISNGAKVVGTHLLMDCGREGYTQKSIKQLAWETNTKLTQLHAYIRELVEVGMLERQAHSGRVNTWIIPEVRAIALARETPSAHRRTIFKSTCTENVKEQKPKTNVISISSQEQPKQQSSEPAPVAQGEHVLDQRNQLRGNTPAEPPPIVIEQAKPFKHKEKQLNQRKPVPHYLIAEIIKLTNDKRSFPLWFKLVTKIDEQRVYHCLRLLNQALMDESRPIQNRGAYFVTILKCECPELFQGQTSSYQPPPVKPVIQEPQVTRDDELNRAGIEAIKALLSGKKSLDVPDANRLNQTRNTRIFR